jgi:hypothetical protein
MDGVKPCFLRKQQRLQKIHTQNAWIASLQVHGTKQISNKTKDKNRVQQEVCFQKSSSQLFISQDFCPKFSFRHPSTTPSLQ